MKIKKGDKIYPVITGDDVIITKGTKHPGKTVDVALEEVDDTLDEHKKEIDKLKSNVKYIYSYGGVGGTGSGGSGGGGGSTGKASLFISLGGHQLQNGGNTIVLSSPGVYPIEGNVSNSNGETFYVTVGYGKKIDYPDITKRLNIEENRCRFSSTVNMKENGEILVMFYDSEYAPLASIRQRYIVNPHTFDMKFKYEFDSEGSTHEGEFNSTNEYFIGDVSHRNPFIDLSFKIDLPNVTNVSLTYSIGDTTDGQGVEQFGSVTDISNNHFKIYLDQLHRNGKQFTDESNTGTYNVSVTLNYSVDGIPASPDTRTLSPKLSLIPGYLYINVRNPQDLLYDSLDDILAAIDEGIEGVPQKNITVGTYTSFYCKIYEGAIKTDRQLYTLTFESWDLIDDDDNYKTLPEVIDFEKSEIGDSKDGVVEQVETAKPISVAFVTPGIKKLIFSTVGQKTYDHSDEKPVVKYIYVKESDTTFDWNPADLRHDNYYFKANLGSSKSYSENFPRLSSGTSPFEMSETNESLTLSDERWGTPTPNCDTTILSFGMQYSVVNNDGAKILETFASSAGSYSQVPDVTLYSDKLFSETSKKICIPTTNNFDKSVSTQYHLVQIVRYKIGYDNQNHPIYASYLYIDGCLESNRPDLSANQLFVGKIVLNNVNVIYNLINLQYVNLESSSYTLDEIIYQYYLAYKQIMHAGEVSEPEIVLFNNLSDIRFDGENVIVHKTFLDSVAKYMPIPTMMMEYTGDDVAEFTRDLFKGYPNGDDSFHQKDINLWWCEGSKNGDLKQLIVPAITDDGVTYSGGWRVELQGTSTMRNRIKNFSLVVNTNNTTGDKVLLMSPNYDSTNPNSFLPERIWTLKADIADSAHANNTAVGMFVNRNCTRFSNGLSLPVDIKPFIKNTLEGFPILMYFKVGDNVYYLGVYNFNMGRNSYYNLGYHTAEDTTNMISTIKKEGDFTYAVGSGAVISTLAIGEVQENFAQFDFHQYDDTVLFQPNESDITRMFGKDSKITAANVNAAKGTLRNFVRSVAKAGTYCFANIGKYPLKSKADNSDECVDRYSVEPIEGENHKFKEYVPDISWQFHYDGNQRVWEQKDEITFDNMRGNIENLLQCISKTDLEGNLRDDYEFLDFTSAAEYYTICMAFGLVDSILKNMNIKSWNGKKCYVAFYDMDCAFGENNAGGEDVSYLAATDFWHSNNTNGYVEPVDINYDYWDNSVGKGFDYPSSYLFAIAKYAQAILSDLDADNGLVLTNYPQQFWAKLRQPKNDDNDSLSGQLCNADYFMNKYFSSGIGKIPSYLTSLNYQVKYLYKGTIINDDGVESEVRYLANESSFNGTRIEKVRTWLNKRLHFLDVMFNVQGIGIPIGGGYNIPKADSSLLNTLSQNNDIIILSDMFSTPNKKTALMSSNALGVDVYAPMNTPFIINRGSSNEIFLLCAGTDKPNTITVNVKQSEAYRFLGSKEFSNLSIVEPFLTDAYQIVSNNIEEIKYGGNAVPPISADFNITSTSVKNVKFDIPTFTGRLVIDTTGLNGQAIHTLDVSRSGIQGSWSGLRNLKSLKISSVSNPSGTISVSDCPLVGDMCVISGTPERPTTLNTLNLTGVSGNFKIEDTNIQNMNFAAALGKDASLDIRGDILLTKLTVSGFKSIKISGCPNLSELRIDDIENVCETIVIDIPEYTNADGTPQKILKKFNSDKDGVFDFRSYQNLKVLGVSGCAGAVVIKMPNHKVSIDTFKLNVNLEFIDTVGQQSIIELTQDSTFWRTPRYGMMQSWASSASNDGVNISTLEGNSYEYSNLHRTKMCVSANCTTLAHTFNKTDSGIRSNYMSEYYTNEWGQNVHNGLMRMNEAAYFINNCVGAVDGLDDAYIDDDGIIHDGIQVSRLPDLIDRRANITSLSACFNRQTGIFYDGARYTLPDMSKFTALDDISAMYYGTSVNYMSSSLLNLPDSRNNNDEANTLNWTEFIGTGDLTIAKDAFKHISYRITDFSIMTLTVKNSDPAHYNETLCADDVEPDERLDVVDILFPKKVSDGDGESSYTGYDPDEEYVPFERIRSFNTFCINPIQWVDYTHLFEVCPNVQSLNSFLNTNLSRAKIDGMLSPCTKLLNISDSFNHTGEMDNLGYTIDLFAFFPWENESLFKMTSLFSSSSSEHPGFSINKRITQANFDRIMAVLPNYKSITSLSNLFSYCTIEGYQAGHEIKLGGSMNKIRNIDSLFYHCQSENKLDTPLKIRRSFFEDIPNVQSMANTFVDVYFDHMPTYDFFCKRIKLRDEDVFVGEEHTRAVLKRWGYDYSNSIYNMNNTFKDAKFVKCRCWFDIEDDNQDLIPQEDVIVDSSNNPVLDENNEPVKTYYKYESGRYIQYTIGNSTGYTDTLNNFTNYVNNITVKASGVILNNHDIYSANGNSGDLVLFQNTIGGNFPYVQNDFNVYPTYCCLPPDILYGCRDDCEFDSTFANTNIIGVIPQHLLKNCYNSKKLSNMLMNTNILPNLIYHYDSSTATNVDYLAMIENITIDNESIMIPTGPDDTDVYTLNGSVDTDAVVLFRNSNGELRRRYPITDNEYSKSQFVYVPQGYTTNNYLNSAFTFRYNLPAHIDLLRDDLLEDGIVWPAGNDYFDKNYSSDNRPDLWPYHTQYFFMVDESVNWALINEMESPFINDGQDVDFRSKTSRVFSTNTEGYDNKWWAVREYIGKDAWDTRMNGFFNSLLDLCGKRNVRTGKVTDCGCMLSIPINLKRAPKLNNFVSGTLVTLLNGRVFDIGVDGGRLTSLNASSVINYNIGYARNIILPQLQYIPPGGVSEAPRVLITHGTEVSWFYNYMFNDGDSVSLNNYRQIYNISSKNLKPNSDNRYCINPYLNS